MPSSFFDETLAQRYENAEFNFPADSLKEKVVVLAGGSGFRQTALRRRAEVGVRRFVGDSRRFLRTLCYASDPAALLIRGEDVARTVRLLLEPDSYITTQVLTVDGGKTPRRRHARRVVAGRILRVRDRIR